MKATVWDITRMTDVEIEANEGIIVEIPNEESK
jgi:hypothetical protein